MLEHNGSPNGNSLHTGPQHGAQNHTNLVTPVHLDSIAFRLEREDSTILSEQRTVISVESIPQRQSHMRRVPTLPPNIHKTVVENMEYWLTHKLWEFITRQDCSLRQLGWDLPVQLRFCRRRDIAKWVKTVGESVLETQLHWETDEEVFIHVAKILDEERGRKTVMKALNEFMDNSPISWRLKRARK